VAGEKTVSVLVPVAVAAPYTYRAPAETMPGDIVEVPLGTRDVVGVVWDDPADPEIGHNRLRPIAGTFEAPPLPKEIRTFVDWVADYTLTSRGMVLRMVLRSTGALAPEAPVAGVRRAGPPPARMTPARERVLTIAGDASWTRSSLAAAAGVTSSVVQGLVEAGTLEVAMMPAAPPVPSADPHFSRPAFSPAQEAGAVALREAVATGGYSVTLLDGVTGSGKTEVYFEAVAAALKAGKQALILVPEIALTAEFLARFALRFGARPAEWHSEVGLKGRERVWRGVADGTVRVVVGARSALFLPFVDLGLIVVDEEHDLAYKQEEGAIYNARDMAVVRAHLAGFPVVLSSATPSIESRVNADAGRYRRVVLPDRYLDAALPAIRAVDLRKDQPERRGAGAEAAGASLP
jgi:primosomal protein N' (replication factor Y) (superfamily II helicase)